MGYDVHVCVYNSYGHRTVSCSGFRRHCETKPNEDRMEIVWSPQYLNGNRTEPMRCPYDFNGIVRTPCGHRSPYDHTLRLPYDFMFPNYHNKSCVDRTIIAGCSFGARMMLLRLIYRFLNICQTAGDRKSNRRIVGTS